MRQFAHRIDQVRHLVRSRDDFLVDFGFREFHVFGFAEKLRIGNDSSKVVPEIVRDRAGSSPEGGDAFGFGTLLLRSQKLLAHLRKSLAELNHLAAAFGDDGVSKIPGRERPYTRHEILERPRDGSRNETKQQRAYEYGSYTHEIDRVIEMVYKTIDRKQGH